MVVNLFYLVPSLTVSLLSIVGSGVLIFLQQRLAYSYGWRRLILYLSICDLFHSIFYSILWASGIVDEYSCYLISLLGMASISCAAFWTAAIAHHLNKSVIRRFAQTTDEPVAQERSSSFLYYHILCWGYPWCSISLIALVNFTSHKVIFRCVANECFGCFLAQEEFGLRLVAVYFPLWSSWLYVVFKYLQIARMAAFRRRLILIPLVYVIIRVPETVFRIYEYVLMYGYDEAVSDDDLTVFVLNILQAFCNPSQGFLNFLFFACASHRWKNVRDTSSCCGCSEECPSLTCSTSSGCGSESLCGCLKLLSGRHCSHFGALKHTDAPLLESSSVNLFAEAHDTTFCMAQWNPQNKPGETLEGDSLFSTSPPQTDFVNHTDVVSGATEPL